MIVGLAMSRYIIMPAAQLWEKPNRDSTNPYLAAG